MTEAHFCSPPSRHRKPTTSRVPLICRTLQIRHSGGGGGDECSGGKGDIGEANFVGTYPYG